VKDAANLSMSVIADAHIVMKQNTVNAVAAEKLLLEAEDYDILEGEWWRLE